MIIIPRKRYEWIDYTKAVCMIFVYLIHSFAFCNANMHYVSFAMPFYVNAFFFVSGFLFFRKWVVSLNSKKVEVTKPKIITALKNLFFRLVIPTILFSAIIYFPKILFHKGAFEWANFGIDVFGGVSFWFTSALVVSQLFFLIWFLCFPKTINMWKCFIVSVIFLFIFSIISPQATTENARDFFPWYWRTGLAYTFLLSTGGIYGIYYDSISKKVKSWMIAISFIIWGSVFFSQIYPHSEFAPEMMGLSGRINIIGLVGIFSSIIVLIYFMKKLKGCSQLEFIGRNSIIFYFFSGAIPNVMSVILARIVPLPNVFWAMLTFVISIIIGYFLSLFITKFMPFLLDIRKFKSKHI